MHEVTYSAFLDELEKIGASKARLNISKSRTGTRPISVTNLLKKDNAGTLHKKAGLAELLKTPIPGTKDWFVNTGKQGLQGALKTTARSGARAAGTVTKGGVTSIGEGELKRMGFGSLSKTGGALAGAYKSVADLKKVLLPGDILLTRAVKPTLMSRVVSAVQGSGYGHSALYAGNGKVIDTRLEGVRETTLDEVHKEWGGGRDVRAYRPKATDEERKNAVTTARSFLGVPYDKKGALRLLLPAAKNDHKGPTDHKDAILCSQLIVQAYPHLNFAEGKHRDHVLPVDIANSPLTKRVGELKLEKTSEEKYKLHGHTVFQGLPIAIENRKGSVRKGVDPDGKPWKTTFEMPYGYFKKTEGKDGEEIDAYVGPEADATHAYVVHQQKLDGSGHDEDKVMLGQPSEAAARQAYLKHYNKVGPKLLGSITPIPMDRLKTLLEKADGKRISKLAEPTTGGDFTMGTSDPFVGGEPGRKRDVLPSREGAKVAGNNLGSGNQPSLFEGHVPERKKSGDVPSRDGTDVGTSVKTEDGRDNVTTLPAGGTQYSSATGAMPR